MFNHPGSLYVNEKLQDLRNQDLAKRELRRSLVESARTFGKEQGGNTTRARQPRFRLSIPRLSPR